MNIDIDGNRLEPGVPNLTDIPATDAAILMAWSAAVSARRSADTAERIATALELIAAHLAPAAVRPASDQPPVVAFAAVETESPWIDWPGGECPVPLGTPVDVRYRDGDRPFSGPAGWSSGIITRDASEAFWKHDGADNDIVAYRLAAPGSTP